MVCMGWSFGKVMAPRQGTSLVKDINTLTAGSYPQALAGVSGTLFFAADNGVHGMELWKSDGTATGTVMVKEIFAGF